MININYVITEPEGLHARPATALVGQINTLKCDVLAACKGQMVDAKSMFGLMSLNAKYKDVIVFTACGEDEQKLEEILIKFKSKNLQ